MRQTAKLQIGGKEFLMQELRAEDHERLDEYVQGRFISAARASLAGLEIDGDEWRATIALAMREAMSLTWMRRPGLGILLSSKRGMGRMLLAGMSGIHIDELVDAMKSVDEIEIARGEFMRINGLITAAAKEGPAIDKRPTMPEQGG